MFTKFFAKRRVKNLDLSSVRAKLVQNKGWNEAYAKEVEREYRKLLYLNALGEIPSVVPWHDHVDEFWHQHMLDSRKYMGDCEKVFGFYLHHNPHMTVGTHRQQKNFQNTQKLYWESDRKGDFADLLENVFDTLGDALCNLSPPAETHSCGGNSSGGFFSSLLDACSSLGSSCGSDSGSSGSSCGSGGSSCGSSCGSGCGSD